jgi:hypothetical protein
MVYPDSGEPRQIPADTPLAPILWTATGLLVQHTVDYTQVPTRLSWVEPSSGRLRHFVDLAPADRFGVNAITRVLVSRDTRHWAFSYRRVTSELFLAEGWK